jgi:hypothetical protein
MHKTAVAAAYHMTMARDVKPFPVHALLIMISPHQFTEAFSGFGPAIIGCRPAS